MLGDTSELSSDLEWMLQSNQASREMLIEALVEEHYAPVYRLAYAILGDSEVAQLASMRTFGDALSNVYRYRSQTGVRLWLYPMALKAVRKGLGQARTAYPEVETRAPESDKEFKDFLLWEAFDSFGWRSSRTLQTRLLLILYYVLDWEISEIAALLQLKESAVIKQLEIAREKFRIVLYPSEGNASFSDEGFQIESLDVQVAESMQRRWPEPLASSAELDQVIAGVEAQANKQILLRQRLTSLMEFGLVVIIVMCAIGLAWRVNIWMPDTGPETTPAPWHLTRLWPASTQAVVYIVKPGDTLERIAVELGVPVEELSDLNAISVDGELTPGQQLYVVMSPSTKSLATPTPVTPTSQAEPLTLRSDSWAILKRIRDSASLWNTLWVDLQMVDYGPQSYLGPPEVYRAQAWISQPDQSLELFGLLSAEPESFYLVVSGDRFFAGRSSEEILFDQLVVSVDGLLMIPELRDMVYPSSSTWMNPEARFIPVESERVAGRRAIVVDWLNTQDQREGRLWLDAYTGLILRLQTYGGSGFQTLLSDSVITAIEYDVDFPQSTLFDPSYLQLVGRGDFAHDYRGPLPASDERDMDAVIAFPLVRRPSIPSTPAPWNFDPSHSWLTFQFSQDLVATDVPTDTAALPVDLFADGYYLGRVAFGLPWDLRCQRSPDGQRIAYAIGVDASLPLDGALRWFNLVDPEVVYQPLPDLFATNFAFSPDSSKLAVFGYGRQANIADGIYILDVGTGEYQLLVETDPARSLVWSPDGIYLAWIETQTNQGREEVIVMHLKTRQIVYQAEYISGRNLRKWPMRDWGVPFPVEMGGMDDCAAPLGAG